MIDSCNRFFAAVGGWCYDHRLLAALLCLGVLAGAVALSSRARIDNSYEAFFAPDDPTYVAYAKYREDFGSDEVSYILYEAPDAEYGAFDLAVMPRIAQLTEALEREVPFVYQVTSLTNAELIYRLPLIQQKYRKTLEKLLGTVWNEDRLLAEVDRVEALVKDHLHKSQRDLPRALRKIRSFIKGRRRVLQRRLDDWPIQFKSGPRRPFYFKQAGSATASFSTAWNKNSPDDPLTHGEATMDLQLDGERVEFKQIGVSAELSKWPTRDGSPQPPTIVFTGTRKSGGLRLTLAFSMAPADFRPTNGKSVSVQGVVIEGRLGFLNPRAWKMMSGRVTFERAEMKPGAAVRGKVKLHIVKMAGGKPTRRAPK